MFKSRLFLSLLAGMLALCAFSGQAKGENVAFKTGEYRPCNGELADCRQGKSLHENEYYYFEKNNTGRVVFRAERWGFLWRVNGDKLEIEMDDGEKNVMTISENSTVLSSPSQGNLVLVMDEDQSFVSGVYYRCPENSDAACAASLSSFLSSFPAPDDNDKLPTQVILYERSEYSQICQQGEKECSPLTWSMSSDDKNIVVTVKGQKVTLRIDRNMLVNDEANERYLRAYSEAVMEAAN